MGGLSLDGADPHGEVTDLNRCKESSWRFDGLHRGRAIADPDTSGHWQGRPGPPQHKLNRQPEPSFTGPNKPGAEDPFPIPVGTANGRGGWGPHTGQGCLGAGPPPQFRPEEVTVVEIKKLR